MRLLLTIGYQQVLFKADADLAAVLHAVQGARMVDKQGYGRDETFTAKGEADVEVKLVPEDKISTPDEPNTMVDRCVALADARNKAENRVSMLKFQLARAVTVWQEPGTMGERLEAIAEIIGVPTDEAGEEQAA